MKSIYKKLLFLSVLLVLVFCLDVQAQCAMCKAVAEDATSEANGGVANGLNKGILYIMAVPYVLILTAGLVFFRKKIGGFFKEFNTIH
jgi:hypothetical protein